MTEYKIIKKRTHHESEEFHDYKRVTNSSRNNSRNRKKILTKATRNAVKELTRQEIKYEND